MNIKTILHLVLVLATFGSTAYGYSETNDVNLIAWLKFDDGSGTTATDSTGNGHDGTLYNMAANDWVTGKDGYALDFDGSNDYVRMADDSELDLGTHDFSYVMWIKKDVAGVRQALVCQRVNGYNWHELEWQTDNTIRLWTKIGGAEIIKVDSATALSANTWYHLVAVVDRDSTVDTKIYINGEDDTEGTPKTGTTDCSLAGPVDVGRNSGGSLYWDGVIDGFHQYNDVLTEEEIAELYTYGVGFEQAEKVGAETTSPATITVKLGQPYSSTVTVDYDVTGGTATGGGVDYTLPSGTLTFSPNDVEEDISITVVSDANDDEENETIVITLSNPTVAPLGEITELTYTIVEKPVRLVCENRKVVDGNGLQIRLRGIIMHGQDNITSENIANLKSWGCNFIRVTMPYDSSYWCTVNGCVEDPNYRGIMREQDLAVMDNIADWCDSNEMYWMFCLQPTYMGFEFDLLQYSPTDPDLYADQMESIGRTIAARYKDYDYLVGYEPFGEPIYIDATAEYAAYKQICEAFTDGIRDYDGSRIVSISALNYAHPSYFHNDIKLDRSNILYAFSYYPCRSFVSYQPWYGDFRYPGWIPDFYRKDVIWLDYYWSWTYGLDDGVSKSKAWNVPIYCHEFGAWGDNEWNGSSPDNSSERFMRDMVQMYEDNNINWIIWRWQEAATDVPEWWKSLWASQTNNRVQIEPHGGEYVGSETVTMQTFVEDGDIYYTTDGTEPDMNDTLYTGSFSISSDATIRAKVFGTGITNQPNDIAVFVDGGREPNTLTNITDGLRYWYYEGEWNTVPNFDTLDADSTGTCTNFDPTLGAETDGKALMWKGYINITTGDMYYFNSRVESSGAMEMYIGDTRVILNGTSVGSTYSVGMIPLKAGRHPIKLCYTRPTGVGSLFDIEIHAPGDDLFVDIADSYLDYDNTAPGQASGPNPANNAIDVAINTDICWTEGTDTVSHDVYFGTSNPPSFVKNQSGAIYAPGILDVNTTYFWRVDEKNSQGTTTGTVWQFTTGNTMSLAGHWAFDDGSGDVATDSSANENDGELKGMDENSWASGQVGDYALNFDGIDDYVQVPADYKLNLGTGDFSFSMWVNKEVAGERQFLFNQRVNGNNWYAMEWTAGNIIQVYGKTLGVERLNVRSDTALSADTWYYIALVVDRDSSVNTKIYINTVEDTNGTPTTANGNDLSLNCESDIGRWSGSGYYFEGTMDDVRFYDWALSADDVNDLYEMGSE